MLWRGKSKGQPIRPQSESENVMEKMMDVENEIEEKGLTAPRVTKEMVEGAIIGSDFHVFPGTTVTVCCLKLYNGFTVTGESACASPENFDTELGEKIAHDDAMNKIWQLEGYLLRQRLYDGTLTDAA